MYAELCIIPCDEKLRVGIYFVDLFRFGVAGFFFWVIGQIIGFGKIWHDLAPKKTPARIERRSLALTSFETIRKRFES